MIQQNGYIKCMKFIKYFSLEKITHTSTAATYRNNFHTQHLQFEVTNNNSNSRP